jgi:RNA polymerase sigma factor (sigma-70 family)
MREEDRLRAALARLPPRLRDAWNLRRVEALTLEEASKRMGVTRERLRQMEIDAERRLHAILRRFGGGDT